MIPSDSHDDANEFDAWLLMQIFVEAEDYAGSSVASDEKTKRWRKALDLPGASPLDDPNLRSESTYGAKPASAAVPTLQEPPTWWETSPPAYVPEAQREVRCFYPGPSPCPHQSLPSR
jgi:hypothetical protein